MKFENKRFLPRLNQEEKIFLVIRQHWVVLFIKSLFWFLFIAGVMLLDAIAKAYLGDVITGRVEILVAVARAILLITGLLGLFIVWTLYYLNTQIITNERIIDVNQKSLLNHATSELHINRCQDVTAEIKGLLATMFNFGNVQVQTAGEQERFVFQAIANPQDVAKLIMELYDQLPKEHTQQKSDT